MAKGGMFSTAKVAVVSLVRKGNFKCEDLKRLREITVLGGLPIGQNYCFYLVRLGMAHPGPYQQTRHFCQPIGKLALIPAMDLAEGISGGARMICPQSRTVFH